ncbi:MAG: hypothetical protein ACU0AZ_11545 [Paracoccaceae bacterium]
MPHAVLSYSSDLDVDAETMLQDIEAIILTHDADAGACKGRAYPAPVYHHSHAIVEISLLNKPHRDTAFMNALSADLERGIKLHLTTACAFSLDLRFSGAHYVTNMHQGQK